MKINKITHYKDSEKGEIRVKREGGDKTVRVGLGESHTGKFIEGVMVRGSNEVEQHCWIALK